MNETFRCPRRDDFSGWPQHGSSHTGTDTWKKYWGDVQETCSYCGSLPPEKFMEFVRRGLRIGVTDKAYKFYVDYPNPNSHALDVLGSSTHGGGNFVAWDDLSKAEKKVVKGRAKNRGGFPKEYKTGFYQIGHRSVLHGKFYTPHMEESHGWEFDKLWSEGKVNFDYRPRRMFIPGPSTQKSEA